VKSKHLRIIIPLAVLVAVGIGYVTSGGVGTLSAIGWGDISLICPLGALSTMLASKLVVPRAVVSLVIAVVLILLFGRLFCGWVCPVPVVGKLRDLFSGKKGKRGVSGKAAASSKAAASGHADEASGKPADALTPEERAMLASCKHPRPQRGVVDSRHFVLGGALLSAAIFGFPVFCLICPIGLTFASVLLVMRLFGAADITWSVLIAPVLLLVEVVFFRKWCSTFCPISALMSLIAKGNRTMRPVTDESKCLETAKGVTCGRCANACPEGIDLHHLDQGTSISECTRCLECVNACPTGALHIRFLPQRGSQATGGGGPSPAVVTTAGSGEGTDAPAG
jgi:ferredoxin-type protein NapH